MTWKTPCVDDPQLWESDDPRERARALAGCHTCWRLIECHAQAETDRTNRLRVTGVVGGIDYTRTQRGGRAPITNCQNAECAKPIDTKGTRRKFCSTPCQVRAARARSAA